MSTHLLRYQSFNDKNEFIEESGLELIIPENYKISNPEKLLMECDHLSNHLKTCSVKVLYYEVI